MTAAKCTICSGEPNIRINKLDYCNACFEKQFLHKTFKHFRKLPLGSRILIYLDGTLSSLVMAHVISRLKNKSLHKFFIHSKYCGVYKEFIWGLGLAEEDYVDPSRGLENLKVSSNECGINPLPREVINAADTAGFNILVFQLHAEQESVMALNSICNGRGMSESLDLCVSRPSKAKALNVFHGVKSKEIRYYHHLNRGTIPNGMGLRRKTSTEAILSRFVDGMDRKNSLALFNILNTVKKIVSDAENP